MIASQRRFAIAFGVIVAALQFLRTVIVGWTWPTLGAWPIALDAYVQCAIFLWAALPRQPASEQLTRITLAYGVAFGVIYRSLFEQLGDATRWSGFNVCVIAVKALLFAVTVAGGVTALRSAREQRSTPT